MKILIIDDDKFIISIIIRLLNKLDYQNISTAMSGHEAVSEMGQSAFDLVISDLNMPDMDGIELMRHFAALDTFPHLILVSGVSKTILLAAERLAKAHNINVLGAVKKPITVDVLKELMNKCELALKVVAQRHDIRYLNKDEICKGLDNGNLVMAYQPQVSVRTGEIIGGEALARWREDDGTILNPISFIPVAEREGLMQALTHAVIKTSLADVNLILRILPSINISINVSVENLKDVNFADSFIAQCEANKIPPENLVLEVTESKIMEDITGPLDIMSRLGMRGIKLSIDDFGTGASSYQNLQLLPFTELKIDRSFVYDTPNNAETRAILESIVFVAKKMNLKIVAEGVEDKEEWDLMSELDIDIIQGYYVAKPMFLDDFLSWYGEYGKSESGG